MVLEVGGKREEGEREKEKWRREEDEKKGERVGRVGMGSGKEKKDGRRKMGRGKKKKKDRKKW